MLHSAAKKIVSAVVTQAIIFALSIITGFVLPKHIGPEMYGYWQVYLFYLSYVNLLGLGLNDGYGLFYGGFHYDHLPFQKLRSSNAIFYLYLAVVSLLFMGASMLVPDGVMREILFILALNIPNVCIQCVALTLFLSVNRVGLYNSLSFFSKFSAVLLYLALILFHIPSASNMMYADSLARFLMTIVCFMVGKRFLLGTPIDRNAGIQEWKEKSRAGIKITIGIVASTLIPVSSRIVIEWTQPIEIYGMYSFVISILAIIVTFSNTAGLVVFPILKTLNQDVLPQYYTKFSTLYSAIIYLCLILYIPLTLVIQSYLKDFSPVLSYLHVILAMCLPLGKVQLLINSYYKSYRLEREFLRVNLISFILVLSGTFLCHVLFGTVLSVAYASTIGVLAWCLFLESVLAKKTGCTLGTSNMITDFLAIAIFIFAASFSNLMIFSAIYISCFALYAVCHYAKLKRIIDFFRKAEASP